MPAHRLVGDQRADRARRRAHATHPARRRRRHAAQPLPAGHRRAVRHPGRDVPGPHRPRPGPRAGLRPEHDVRAAPRPHRRPTRSRRTCWSCRATSPASRGSRASTPSRARARRCRCTSSARRCSAPTLAAALGLPYAFASHFAPAGARGRGRGLPARVPAVGAARRGRTSSPASTSSPPTRGRGRGAAADESPRCGRSACSGAAGHDVHRRGGRPAAGRTARPSTSTRCSPTPRSARRPRSASTWSGSRSTADADELIVAHQSPTPAARLRSVELLAEAMTLARDVTRRTR